MAITATFTADFDDFNREVKKAEGQLDLFETEVGQAGRAVGTLDATTKQSGTNINNVSTAYRAFDGVLKAAGINLGPVIRGLEDLAGAAGKTYTQLGLLGTVGLAAAVGTITYNITKSISSFVGLDKAIGDNMAKWLGWGDVAAQEAGAVADVLALASTRAGKTITDYTEAIRINAEWQKAKTKATKEDIEAQKEWAKANEAVVIASQNHSAILARMNPQIVEASKFALEHGVSQKDVATAYKLTAPEIAAVNWQLEQQVERLKELEAWNKLVADAMKAHWDGVGAVVDQVLGVDALQAATTWTDAINAMGGSVANLRANELEQLKATMLGGIDALARMGQLTTEQSSHFAALAVAADQALAALRPQVTVTEDLSKAMWEYVRALDAEAAAQQKAGEAAAAKAAGDAQRATSKTDKIRELGEAFRGTIKGGNIGPTGIPTHGGRVLDMFGRPVTTPGTLLNLPRFETGFEQRIPYTNIVINGSVLSDKDEIARVVGDAITQSYAKGGRRLPV